MRREGPARELWTALPNWSIVEKFDKGRAVYVDSDLDLSQPLYRYMRADDAFKMLEKKALWFSAPHRWDDPHEKWWCDLLFRDGSHLGTAYAYGSCWTTRSHDEPFWRLYGCRCVEDDAKARRKKIESVRVLPAVRFRAKADKLLHWLCESARGATCKAFMGHVRYCPVEQLRAVASNARASNDNPARIAADGLHMKRLAYQFEDEVRLLWIDRKDRRGGHPIALDPLELFDQVMIGPTRADDEGRYLEVAARLMDRGIPEARIKPSSIWQVPKLQAVSARSIGRMLAR